MLCRLGGTAIRWKGLEQRGLSDVCKTCGQCHCMGLPGIQATETRKGKSTHMERKPHHAPRARGSKQGQAQQPCGPARSCSTSRPRASCGRCRPAAAARARAGRGTGAWSRAARASSRSACSAAAAAPSAPAACRTRRTGRRARPGRAQAPRSRCQHSMRRHEGAPAFTPLQPFRTQRGPAGWSLRIGRRQVVCQSTRDSKPRDSLHKRRARHALAGVLATSSCMLHTRAASRKARGGAGGEHVSQSMARPSLVYVPRSLLPCALWHVTCRLLTKARGASLAKTASAAAARCGGGRAVCVPTRGPRVWLSRERGLLASRACRQGPTRLERVAAPAAGTAAPRTRRTGRCRSRSGPPGTCRRPRCTAAGSRAPPAARRAPGSRRSPGAGGQAGEGLGPGQRLSDQGLLVATPRAAGLGAASQASGQVAGTRRPAACCAAGKLGMACRCARTPWGAAQPHFSKTPCEQSERCGGGVDC